MCLVQSIKHRMLCGKAAQTSCLRYTGEPRFALSLLRCSSTLWCKQQARGISPSVTAFSSFIRRATVAPSPLAARASAYALHLRTAVACLSRCFRHRRRSKAKPLRGSRGGSAAEHRIAQGSREVRSVSLGKHGEKPSPGIFSAFRMDKSAKIL